MRYWLAAFGALLLGSCSLPKPVIRAAIVNGQVVFDAYEPGGSQRSAISTYRFSVYGRDGAVWVIEPKHEARCLEVAPSALPAVYGRVPDCFFERLPAAPLRQGVLYQVETGNGPAGNGVFRLGAGAVENFDGDSVPAEIRDWPAEHNPNTTYPSPDWRAFQPDHPNYAEAVNALGEGNAAAERDGH